MEKTKTLPSTWRSSIQQLLEQWQTRQNRQPRIAILGVGNTLRSDDAAGVLVAQRLADTRLFPGPASVLVLEAGHAPENSTAELRHFAPDLLILVDAADLNEAPGSVRWIDIDEIDSMSASTHTLPLSILARYLTLELGCSVHLLGIQPRSVDVGEAVCMKVLQSVNEIVDGLIECIYFPVPN